MQSSFWRWEASVPVGASSPGVSTYNLLGAGYTLWQELPEQGDRKEESWDTVSSVDARAELCRARGQRQHFGLILASREVGECLGMCYGMR